MGVLRECLPIFVCASVRFGFDGGMWDLNVLVPDHCLSFYFSHILFVKKVRRHYNTAYNFRNYNHSFLKHYRFQELFSIKVSTK